MLIGTLYLRAFIICILVTGDKARSVVLYQSNKQFMTMS